MMTKPVQSNQSMLDVIIMACGSMEGGMAFCALNNVAISDVPAVGAVYKIPSFGAAEDDSLIQSTSDMMDAGVLSYLAGTNINEEPVVIGTLGSVTPGDPLLNDDGDTLLNDDGSELFNDNN
jgi:hypothetical protein